MRLLRFALLAFILAPLPSFAQTVVSGTVADPNGFAYSGATLTVSMTSGGNTYVVPPVITLNSAGQFSVNLQASVGGNTYSFSARFVGIAPPLGTGPQTCLATGITVSGSAQTVTFTCPVISNTSSGSVGNLVPSTTNVIGLQTTPVTSGSLTKVEVSGSIIPSAVPNVQSGAQYSLPAYSQPGIANLIGPIGINVTADLQSMNIPKNLTVGGAITIGSSDDPFTGFLGTLQPSGCMPPGSGLWSMFLADEVTGLPLWSAGSNPCQPMAILGGGGVSAGKITLSAGSGSHSFTVPYPSTPICTVNDDTTSTNAVSKTVSTSSIAVTGTGTDVISWICSVAAN